MSISLAAFFWPFPPFPWKKKEGIQRKRKSKRLGILFLSLDALGIDNRAGLVDGDLLLLGGVLDGVGGLEDLVQLLELCFFIVVSWVLKTKKGGLVGEKLTVRPLVSGMKNQTTMTWMASQMVKMMYVFQSSFSMDTGQANWLRRPAALTASDEKAMPLARISKDRT